jgi:hypothetical protein
MQNKTGMIYDDKVTTSNSIYKWILNCDSLVHVSNFYGVITVIAPNRKTTMAIMDGLWEDDNLSGKFDLHRISNEIIVITANK